MLAKKTGNVYKTYDDNYNNILTKGVLMQLDKVLHLVEKIDAGMRDRQTVQSNLAPLWNHPLLREAFITMLNDNTEYNRANFEIIADLLSPSFVDAAKALCPEAWLPGLTAATIDSRPAQRYETS